MSLFDLFKISKLIEMKDGEINLMKTPVNIIPTSILCNLQKGLIDSIGFRKTYERLYKDAKEGSKIYNKHFIDLHDFSDKHKSIDWQTKIVTLAGWGNIEIALIDFEQSRFIAHFQNSPFPRVYKELNGVQKYAIDFIATGFVAGGLSVVAGKDLEAVETKCIARNDNICEIEVGLPKIIKDKRERFWTEWGINK